MEYTIHTDKLVKKYKNRTVVNEVSINFTQGEIVGLLGPNGAGKTTSFYMIVGLIKPYSVASSSTTRIFPTSRCTNGRKWVLPTCRRNPPCSGS